MRKSKKFIATLASGALAACVGLTSVSTAALAQALPTPTVALKGSSKVDFEKFATSEPKGNQASEAEVKAFFEAINDLVVFSAEAVEQDGEGVVARNAKLAIVGAPDVGLQFSELRLWDANPGKKTIGRLDAKGATYFGIEDFTNEISSQVTKAIAEEFEGTGEIELGMTIEKYDFKIGRILIDGAKFYDWPEGLSLKATSEANDVNSLLKLIGTVGRMMGADAYAVYDMNGDMAYTQLGQKTEMSFFAATSGVSGWDRGNIDHNFIKNFGFKMKLPVPSEDGETFQYMDMDYEYGSVAVSDLKLDKVFESFSRGEVPDTSVTDLMSLGTWVVEDEKQSLNGQVIASVEKSVTDFSSFHWFVPTSIKGTVTNATIGIGAFMNFVKAAAPASDVDAEMFAAIEKSLAENGLETIRYSGDFSTTWDPKNGELALKTDADLAELGSFTLVTDGILPAYEEFAPMIPLNGEEFNEAAFQGLLMQKSGLDNFELSMTDAGGLDRTFALAGALAKVIPSDDPTVAAMAEMSPEELRQMASGTVRVSALALTQIFPPAMSYVNNFASFLDDGGTIKAILKPTKRLDFQTLGEAAQLQADPAALEEFLGISVVHEKP